MACITTKSHVSASLGEASKAMISLHHDDAGHNQQHEDKFGCHVNAEPVEAHSMRKQLTGVYVQKNLIAGQ